MALVIAAAATSIASAQEYLQAQGALSDEDFYRLVSCAAPPGGTCAKPLVRWPKDTVSIGITRLAPAYLGGKKKRAEVALDLAIAEINSSGAALTLTKADCACDIELMFLDIPARSTIEGSGYPMLEGTPISAAGVRVFAKDGVIRKAVIIVTTGLQRRAYESVILEETVQALGLLTDIGGPYYESRSILSQTSNALKKLGIQDIMALERHYPAR